MKLRIYNSSLDPSLWNSDKTLKPEVQEHLIKIAEDFYNSTDLEGEVQNILFIGSSANYNWTPTSDIDLHVVIDIATEKINEEYARKFMDSLSFKWNTEHDIELKGHPVEIYLQDLREPNSDASKGRPGASIYSLIDGKWLIEPKHEVPDVDADKVRQKYQVIKNKVKRLAQNNDITHLKELMKSIRNYRNAGLAQGGEFSVENLVFKALRKDGDLEKIKTTINTIYDKQASLPENGNVQPDKKTSPMNEVMIDKTKPFHIIGMIDDDLHINSIVDYGAVKGHHNLLNFDIGQQKRWRYNSLRNIVYWFDDEAPTEDEKTEVSYYLDRKYAIVNPKHEVSVMGYFKHGHDLTENINDDNKLYVGLVDDDTYRVYVLPVTFDNIRLDHGLVAKKFGINPFNKQFRFRKDLGKCWWYDRIPTTLYRDVVNEWAKESFGMNNITHILINQQDLPKIFGIDLFFPDKKG